MLYKINKDVTNQRQNVWSALHSLSLIFLFLFHLKVSPTCDEVLVNGQEKGGHQSLAVKFTYLHLSAQLQLTVWLPKLQIDLSDSELSQVKGWRVPIINNKR